MFQLKAFRIIDCIDEINDKASHGSVLSIDKFGVGVHV